MWMGVVSTLGFIAFAVLLLVPHQGMAQNANGLGINITDICDLRSDGSTKLSDKCYGFIGAIAEIAKTHQLEHDNLFGGICIPDGVNVEQIYEAIRPKLAAGLACFGTCTSSDLVIVTLAHTFPCKQ